MGFGEIMSHEFLIMTFTIYTQMLLLFTPTPIPPTINSNDDKLAHIYVHVCDNTHTHTLVYHTS